MVDSCYDSDGSTTTPDWLRQLGVQILPFDTFYTIQDVFGETEANMTLAVTTPPVTNPAPVHLSERPVVVDDAHTFIRTYWDLEHDESTSREHSISAVLDFLTRAAKKEEEEHAARLLLLRKKANEGEPSGDNLHHHHAPPTVGISYRLRPRILPVPREERPASAANGQWHLAPLIPSSHLNNSNSNSNDNKKKNNNKKRKTAAEKKTAVAATASSSAAAIPPFYDRPRATFWLDVGRLGLHFQNQARTATMLLGTSLTAPFLTVEFVEDRDVDGGEPEAYLYRMALAGTVVLYNHFRLRRRALASFTRQRLWESGKKEKPKEEEEEVSVEQQRAVLTKDLVHFGMTFSGLNYCVWKMEPIVGRVTAGDEEQEEQQQQQQRRPVFSSAGRAAASSAILSAPSSSAGGIVSTIGTKSAPNLGSNNDGNLRRPAYPSDNTKFKARGAAD